MLLTAAGESIYVTNYLSGTLSVINSDTYEIIKTVILTPTCNYVAVSPNGLYVYVGNYLDDTVTVIETAGYSIVHTITMPANSRTSGIAFTPDGLYAYVANNQIDSVSVLETTGYSIITTISLPAGSHPLQIAINPNGDYAYIANKGDGTVSVIQTSNNTLLTTFPATVPPNSNAGSNCIAINSSGTREYVTNFESRTVTIIKDNSLFDKISLASNPSFIAISPNNSYAYITLSLINSVAVLEFPSKIVLTTIAIRQNSSPAQIAIHPNGDFAYVTEPNTNSLAIIDLTNNTYLESINTGTGAKGVAVNPFPQRTNVNPPNNFLGQSMLNNFILASEHFNNLSWNTPNSRIAGYRLSRNGILIANLPSNTIEYEDHNRPIGQTDIYSLVAYNENGLNSMPISLTIRTD